MREGCCRGKAWAIVAVACSVAPLLAAEPAEETLKEAGLRRSGTTYVLPAEAEVQKKLGEARALYKQLSFGVAQQKGSEQAIAEGKAMLRQMVQQRIVLNQQYNQAGSVPQKNQLAAMINELNDRVSLLNEQVSDPKADERLGAQVAHQREAFVQAVLGLRELVDETGRAYAKLAEDPAVREALDALNQKAKTKLTLGPSRAYQANVALLEKVEATVLTESVTMRKDGGVFWLDVTFNGKVTKPMIFDTGASLTTLPAQMAEQIGLRPGPSDPTIQCQIADGTVVEARQMTIPSMRVGKFTVKDVSCAVMPPGKEDVPPLLGGSFHRLFDYKFSPDSGKLVLSKVETPDEARPAPKAKAGRTTKSRR